MADSLSHERLFDGTQYHSLGQIGQGGMGTVYLVEHRETGSRCVAKVIHPYLVPDAQALDRFRLEAQSLGRLEHPHIVEVLGAGTTADDRPFVVLEYLKGRTLSDELHDDGMSIHAAIEYAKQYLSALTAAHQFGIVHRDFKPANLFLCDTADRKKVLKVLDFGLAKVLPNAPTEAPTPLADPTAAGMVLGTPRYMSPEAAQGSPVDQRADIYAAGLVLYKMLAGRGPFDHYPQSEQMAAHVNEEPTLPSTWADIPPQLDEIVLRALTKAPEKRFSSAQEFSDALAAVPSRSLRPTQRSSDDQPNTADSERTPKTSPPPKKSRPASQTTLPRLILLFLLALGFSALAALLIRYTLLGA